MSLGTSPLNVRGHISPKCPSNAFEDVLPGRGSTRPSVMVSNILIHHNAGDLLHGLDKIGSQFLLNAGCETLKSVDSIQWDLGNNSRVLYNPTMVLASKAQALKIRYIKFYAPKVQEHE